MNLKEEKIKFNDILALEAVIDLLKEFFDKILIKKGKFNSIKLKKRLEQLKKTFNQNKNSSFNEFVRILKKLKLIVRKEVLPEIFFIVAGHGGIIINDVGFCEFDSPSFALDRLVEKMKLALETKMPYNIEIAVSCLHWLKNQYPKEFLQFVKLFQQGRFEIINPSYSQPYSLIINAESNIKQIEYGLKALREMDLDCNVYYASECSVHPQIPQILKGFGINFCSLRTRLLGMNPTTPFGNIDWVGLDNTKIQTIITQSGIFNGEYWHGTFFQEIPNLLFQAVSNPFIKYLVYSSIEDLVMSLPYQEEIWSVSKFLDIFGKFILCSEFFQLTEKNGEFKFNRDSFFLGDSIFLPSELFLNNRNSEISILTAEIINCILGLFNKKSDDSFLDELWKKLLLTQAHDCYAVPFICTGDYSHLQLSKEEYNRLKIEKRNISISELSIQIHKEIQKKCRDFINSSLINLVYELCTKIELQNDLPKKIFVFNPTLYLKRELISVQLKLNEPEKLSLISEDGEIKFHYQNSTIKFISEVPELGYKIYAFVKKKKVKHQIETTFRYKIKILGDQKTIQINYRDEKVYVLQFQSLLSYNLSIKEQYTDNVEERTIILGKLSNQTFKIEIIQYNGINRLEFILNSNLLNRIILKPKIKITKTIINYPFGIEETKRSKIQTLDFLWLKGEKRGIIYMQKNSQKFVINRKNFIIQNIINGKGRFEFAISISNEDDLNSVLFYINSYYFKFLGIKLDGNYKFHKRIDSFFSIKPPIPIINLWRRKDDSYIRLLNPSQKEINIKFNGKLIKDQLNEIDFNYKKIELVKSNHARIDPWKIKTFKL